ncbi:hypothetical protein G7046_g8965 [Stylonectria norvegica]|nr:hypothetical protein G7046_g8965 [Stylonectria norvegica]
MFALTGSISNSQLVLLDVLTFEHFHQTIHHHLLRHLDSKPHAVPSQNTTKTCEAAAFRAQYPLRDSQHPLETSYLESVSDDTRLASPEYPPPPPPHQSPAKPNVVTQKQRTRA